jgi:uncharacterized protein YjbJ (UPF0337 family)
MNNDQFQGKWKQLKGKVKQQWGQLTDDDIQSINGSHEVLVGKLQERYGYAKEEAQRRANDWMNSMQKDDSEYAHSGSPSGSERHKHR